jgi:hypothetical protein
MWMRVRATLAIALPRRCFLLRDADHHDPEAPFPLGLLHVPPRGQLLRLALLEADHRDPVASDEALERAHVRGADLPQRRRRGNREATIQQETHDLPLGLKLREIASEKDPVDRVDLERHPLPQ